MHFIKLLAGVCICASTALGVDFAITGVVKDADGNIIKNALIKFETAGYVTVSNTQGGFLLSEHSPVQRVPQQKLSNAPFTCSGGVVHFSVSGFERVAFSVYTLQGKLCTKKQLPLLGSGNYRVQLQSLLPPGVTPGTYLVATSVGAKTYSTKLLHQAEPSLPFAMHAEGMGEPTLRTAKTATQIDLITISKLGYVAQTIPIESYKTDIGVVTLQKSNALEGAAAVTCVEDSLFNLFIERVQALDKLNGPSELRTIDYISIRTGFETILEKDSLRVKSNIGYIVTALASLNVNSEVWKLADSLDAYFASSDSVNTTNPPLLMKKAMKQGGVLALGKAMAVKTPQVVMATVQHPSFPKFITISYLQDVIDEYLMPVLFEVQKAAERVERLETASMEVTVDGDVYKIDKGEVYLFDASVNLLRAYCALMCTYDMDLYTSSSQKDYSWIDTLVNSDNNGKTIYTISGDTLYEISSWNGDKKSIMTMANLVHYNVEERPAFMTIRRPYHEAAFGCLKAVPNKIKSGLASIRAEKGDQKNDLLKIAMLDTADADMLDLSGEMTKEGLSAAFADNFSSIDKLMDFMIKLQSGPFTFDEVVDGKQVQLTINLPTLFTNPVNDLRTLLPYYEWTNKAEWVKADAYSGGWENYPMVNYNSTLQKFDTCYRFSVYNSNNAVEVKISQSVIDSVNVDEYNKTKTFFIKIPIRYNAYIDSSYYFDALRLKDDKGAVLSEKQINDLIDQKAFFPYFKDYTFNGLFPQMTREKWLDLVWSTK